MTVELGTWQQVHVAATAHAGYNCGCQQEQASSSFKIVSKMTMRTQPKKPQ